MSSEQFQAASAVRVSGNFSAATEEICAEIQQTLGNDPPDLTFAFVSYLHVDDIDEIARIVSDRLQSRILLGCTGESIVGNDREFEMEPAISVWAARMPGASIEPFHLRFSRVADSESIVCEGLPDPDSFSAVSNGGAASAGEDAADNASEDSIFLLGEPFSCAGDVAIDCFEELSPGAPIFGGMASGGTAPGKNRLIFNGEIIGEGAVGVVVHNGPAIRPILSQGCEPIGTTMLVTKADRNVIGELGRRPVIEVIREQLESITEEQQQLIENGLHIGIVMDEYRDHFQRGDFLVANVLGFDQERDIMAVSRIVRVGQTVQLHVRDDGTAHQEMVELMTADRATHKSGATAALVFSCNGRGTRLFDEPNHDAGTIGSEYGSIPTAGFFAQGEFGPVGDKNYVHGYTASIALFTPR